MLQQKGANKSSTVTKISSLGHWVPVHDDEWDGDIPVHFEESPSPEKGEGDVVLKGEKLPWVAGLYEVRTSSLYEVFAYKPLLLMV